MHKKSAETSHTSPRKPSSLTPPPTQEKPEDAVMEEEKEKHTKDTNSPISKEELRENSIAALRAKAQEHSAKMLGTVSDRTNGHVAHKEEEAEDKVTERETVEVEKSNWKRLRETDWWPAGWSLQTFHRQKSCFVGWIEPWWSLL